MLSVLLVVDRRQVGAWWIGLLRRHGQQFDPCHHVLVLRAGCCGTRTGHTKIPRLEKVFDDPSDGAVCVGSRPRHSGPRLRLRLPSLDAVRSRRLHGLIPRPLWQLLSQRVSTTAAAAAATATAQAAQSIGDDQ